MTESYSFIDIFNKEIVSNGESIKVKQVVIPIIQRDYAQGREDVEVKRVRDRFLDALYDAVTDNPIVLDFVYGDVDENGIMTPLDGQQRLTTLYLLHWYAAKKENINYDDYSFLKNFSYQTRYSARDFCRMLIDYNPSFTEKISLDIINQSWFPLDWQKDQTIKSMLVMLDAIEEKFCEVNNIWDSLLNNSISFYFLPIKDMGLSDELYIKMNSRGKPLTRFENFKAELEREIVKIDNEIGRRIVNKIDKEWTDLLWVYRDENNNIDDFFLRYFKYICDIICYKNDGTPLNKSHDEIDLINEYFTEDVINAKENILMLENYFDCWVNVTKKLGIANMFNKYIDYDHNENKIIIDTRYGIDAFKDCINIFGDNQRQFPLGRQVLLYAFIIYLLNPNDVNDVQFRRRIRIVNNLINNSADELSNSEARIGGNRIPTILRQVDSIIKQGIVPNADEVGFNARQLSEEFLKLEWTKNNNELSEKLFELEDCNLLFGQIGILGIENYHLFDKFLKLFSCNWDKVDCALLAIGDYSQADRWRTQLGSKENATAWINLFHKEKYANTKKVLCELLNNLEEINNSILDNVINDYLHKCETDNLYDWRYYYIKYSEFRPGRYGKYWWEEGKENQYLIRVMVTDNKISQNSYQPFLKAIDKRNLISRDDCGQKIIDKNIAITVDNDGYSMFDMSSNTLVNKITIKQNDSGIDMEDRILKMKNIYI